MKLIALVFFVSLHPVLSSQHVVSKRGGLTTATSLRRRTIAAESNLRRLNIFADKRNATRRRRKPRRRRGKKTKKTCHRLRRNICNRCQKRFQRQEDRGMCDQIERCEVGLMACVKKRQFQIQNACGGRLTQVLDCKLQSAAGNTSP